MELEKKLGNVPSVSLATGRCGYTLAELSAGGSKRTIVVLDTMLGGNSDQKRLSWLNLPAGVKAKIVGGGRMEMRLYDHPPRALVYGSPDSKNEKVLASLLRESFGAGLTINYEIAPCMRESGDHL